MTYALLLAFFRNDIGFGGNNGLTDFKDILGFNVQADGTRAALFAAELSGADRRLPDLPRGRDLEARQGADRDPRRRIAARASSATASNPTSCSCSRCRPAWPASPARSTCRRSASSIPSEFAPGNSIEAVIWVAVGGRGTLIGAALGAVVVNYAKTFFTSGPLAPYWLFMLGALFILVTLLLPKGIVGTFNAWWEPRKAQQLSANAESAAREDGVGEPKPAE